MMKKKDFLSVFQYVHFTVHHCMQLLAIIELNPGVSAVCATEVIDASVVIQMIILHLIGHS